MTEFLSYFDYWQLIAGLGLFLFGMMQTEQALAALGGRRLKLFLRRYTDQPLRAILTGIGATAVIQSSSAVGLMTLAFVGAGIIELANALGVIIGANLGTTMTGWIVTLLGFKLDIGRLALVLIAIGSVVMLISDTESRFQRWGRFATGFGLLFFGLGLMKDSFQGTNESVQALVLSGGHPLVYLALGFVLTAVIQSSSAMMMITLSALNAGLIRLDDAAAVVIGADLGTTITVLIGGLRGAVEKRRVALAHVLFNLITDLLAFLVILPLLPGILTLVGIADPLFGLVAFHSLFNLVGIALFYPFLGRFADLLRRLVPDRRERLAKFLSADAQKVPEAGLEAMEQEVDRLADEVLTYIRAVLDLDGGRGAGPTRYRTLKRLEAEILEFGIGLERQPLDEAESHRLRALQAASRNLVHAAKCLKDIRHNLEAMAESANRPQEEVLEAFRTEESMILRGLESARAAADEEQVYSELVGLVQSNQESHRRLHELVIDTLSGAGTDDPVYSSLLNVNRELFVANYDLISALGDRRLTPKQADELGNLPLLA